MSNAPLLSIVVVTRNDNHGQSLNYRTQEFIDLLTFQCEKFELRSELIIVEWNPPKDKQKLIHQFNFPPSKYLSTRIIEVPNDIHLSYEFSTKIPLYQMIGKNVGIFRAAGQFILATNIDVLFSDDIFTSIINKIDEETVYTAVRHDIPPTLPNVGPRNKLKWSSKNYFRVHHSLGSITLKNKFSNIFYRIFGRYYIIYNIFSKNRIPYLNKFINFNSVIFYRIFGSYHIIYNIFSKNRIPYLNKFINFNSVNLLNNFYPTIKKCAMKIFYDFKNLYLQAFGDHDKPHTNACGDFTLCSKKIWDMLRGYPEWDMYSWHIDSVFIHQAENSGFSNKIIEGKIFHIEHSPGSGYTPEHADLLFDKFKKHGIPCLSDKDLAEIILRQKNALKPILYNPSTWGLSNFHLVETKVR